MKKNRLLLIGTISFFCATLFSQNPTVQNGVATYHSNKNIGRKFEVPNSWNKIVIKKNVTITGSFYFPTRTTPMEIAGESRVTSIIKGDGTRPYDDGINGRSYSAIRFDKSPDVYIHDLRSLDPMKFHIGGGFGNVLVERCDLIETRGSHSSDGIHGGNQKVIVRDCYISTYDDALYTRECTLVENTTIVHNKNGAPFMTSWGAGIDPGSQCIVRNCTVIDNYDIKDGYNHGVFGWAGKHSDNAQTINIKFEGTFTYQVAPGKVAGYMYSIGRWSGTAIKNATIKVNGICPGQNSVLIRPGTQNCKVEFVNCGSSGGGNDDQPIPGKIEAEDFASQSGTQTENCSEGGQNVGWIDNGDWLDYNVDVASAGDYKVDFRVASQSATIKFDLKKGNSNLTSVSTASTGGWQTWKTVSKTVSLSAGKQTLRLQATGSSWNINWIEFTQESTDAPIGETISLQGNNGMYVSSENGTKAMICDRASVGSWEKFTIVDAGSGKIALQGNNGKYVTDGSPMWCNASTISNATKFTWTDAGGSKIALKGNNNNFASSENGTKSMNCNRSTIGNWEKFDWNIVPKSALVDENIVSEVSIYPNPAVSNVTIELNKVNGYANVEILNMNGQLVLKKELFNSIEQINIEAMESGLYMVKIQNGNSVNIKTLSIN